MVQYFPVVTGSLTVTGSINVSGGITASGGISISGSIASASFASTASFVALAQSASNAVASATASFANAFTVAGNLTAQTLVVQTITSSVDFVTGSTRFGSLLGNTHVFSGSVSMNPNGLFVSSSGTVGIGTTIPSSTFHIRGTFGAPLTTGASLNGVARFGQTSGQGGLDIGFGDPYSWLQSRNATDYSVNYNLVLQPNGGNVGIGTSSPDSKLHIISNASGGTNNYALRLQNTTTVSDARVGIAFLDNSNTGSSASGATIQVSNNGVDGAGNLLFGTLLNGTNTERIRITSTGALSIKNGTQPTGNGLHSYFTSDVGYIDSLEANVAWRDLRIAANSTIFWAAGVERFKISNVNSRNAEINTVGNVISSFSGTGGTRAAGASWSITLNQVLYEFETSYMVDAIGFYAPGGVNIQAWATGIIHFMSDGSTNGAHYANITSNGISISVSATNAGVYTVTFTNTSGASMSDTNARILKLNRMN